MNRARRIALYWITFALWMTVGVVILISDRDSDISRIELTAIMLVVAVTSIASVTAVLVSVLCPLTAAFSAGFRAGMNVAAHDEATSRPPRRHLQAVQIDA